VRTLLTAAVLAIVVLVVLAPFLQGSGFTAPQLVLTAAVLLGGGLLLRRQSGMTRTFGSVVVLFGIAALALAIAVLVFVVLWCCP
jgi:hypothetical protein